MQPPAQELVARDLHDTVWTFRHIYRGMFFVWPLECCIHGSIRCHHDHISKHLLFVVLLNAGQPKRHLLTTGWSLFVSGKRLFAGDSVLFIRYSQ